MRNHYAVHTHTHAHKETHTHMGEEYSVERWKDSLVFKEFAEKSPIHVILVAGLAQC